MAEAFSPSVSNDDITYLEKTSNEFNGPVNALKKRMDDALEEVKKDPTDSASMATFQSAMASYTTLRAAQSGTIKSLKDSVQGIISKF